MSLTVDVECRRLGIAIAELNLFLRREVVSKPRLSSLGLTANPVAHDHPFIGVALPLYGFVIQELSLGRRIADWVSGNCFYAQVEVVQSRKVGQIQARADTGTPWSTDRAYVIMHEGVGIERQPFAQIGDA